MIPGITAGRLLSVYAGPPFLVDESTVGNVQFPSSFTVPWPAGHQQYDIALLYVCTHYILGAHTINVPSGFTLINDVDLGSSHGALFWRRLDGTESGSVTIDPVPASHSSSTSDYFASLAVYRGCKLTGTPYESNVGAARSSTENIGAIGSTILEVVGPDRLYINHYTVREAADTTPAPDITVGSGFTQRVNTTTGTNHRHCIHQKTLTTPCYQGELSVASGLITAGFIHCRAILIPETPISSTTPTLMDSNIGSTSCIMGFEGADAAVAIINERNVPMDSDKLGTTAETDTAQSKFGSASLRASSGSQALSDNAGWHFGSGAFTVEAWVRFSAVGAGTDRVIMGQYDTGANQRSWALRITTANNLDIIVSSTGASGTSKASGAWAPSTGVWYHVAADFDGTNYRTYINGVMNGKTGTPVTLLDSTAQFTVGGFLNSGAHSGAFNGWIDEVRVTKGVARYASDAGFTAPTAAFPRS